MTRAASTFSWLLAFAANAAPPTFHRDVEPILQRRCQSCHRPGEIGKMPLLTYEQARPWAKAIRQAVVLGKMPPWFAAKSSLEFENDAHLTADEVRMLDEWARSGAPRGNPSDAPAPRMFQPGWNIPAPDLTVQMPEPVRVPAAEEIDYQFVVIPLNLKEDRWATAVEIRPRSREAVHHAVLYVREPDSKWLRGDNARVTTSDILAIYTPGQGPMMLPAGMAKKIPAGSDFVLQMHYTPTGKEVQDRTSVGLVFSKEPPAHRVLTLQMHRTDFNIPPGDSNHRVSVSGTLPGEALLLSLFPHLHLRGKAFLYERLEPNGRVETLLEVRPYDFYWQLAYRLKAPRLLPAGTLLRFTAWYDNSVNNPRNPDPSVEVTYGEKSSDEMMVGFFDVAVPPNADKSAFFRR